MGKDSVLSGLTGVIGMQEYSLGVWFAASVHAEARA